MEKGSGLPGCFCRDVPFWFPSDERDFVPAAFFEKKEKESWFFLFLLSSFLIGCATVAYMITLPEDFGSSSPRQHMRYLEPLAIPFFILMISRVKRFHGVGKEEKCKIRFRVLGIGILLFAVLLVCLGAGGGSFLADNSTLLYYELFARFLCKSDEVLTAVRIIIAAASVIGFFVFCKNRKTFLWLFCVIFICLNIVNSLAGCLAGRYRYGVSEEWAVQASAANEYLWQLQGNVLLVSIEGTSPEDKRLLDTYVDRDFYVMNIDSAKMEEFLGDSVLDLKTEYIRCDIAKDYYPGLTEVDYLLVYDDYGIRFRENAVERQTGFPLEGYSLYRNLESGKIYIDTVR